MRNLLPSIAIAVVAVALPAGATPLYFEGNLGVGFDPADPDVVAEGVDIVFGPDHSFESAGAPATNPLLEVTTSLLGQPFVPAIPSFADPILANVLYVVRNTTGAVLDDEHLVFTFGGTVDGNPDPYPALEPDEFAVDVAGIVLVETANCSGNPVGPCVFGAVALPVMAPGATVQFSIVHVLADSLSGSTVIPTPGLALLVHDIPEPSAALLVLGGLALLVRSRRR